MPRLRPKHRREIRDLLTALLDDKVWQPHHVDAMLRVIREARSDVADEIETTITRDLVAAKREAIAARAAHVDTARDVEKLRDLLSNQHAKIAALLELLIDLPVMKAMTRDPATGEMVFDPSLISDKDAKIALSAVEKVLKVTGALAPPTQHVEVHNEGAFSWLDAIEVEEVKE